MWIILGLNTNTPDYLNYLYMYIYSDTSIYATHEMGYIWFCRLFHSLGLTFQQFRMIYAFFYMMIVVKTIRQYTNNVNFVLVLFFIFPFLPYVSGLRNTMAAAIVCYSIHFLFERNKKGTTKYIIGILAATLFHYSSLFYLVFLFARRKINVLFLLAIGFLVGGIATHTTILLHIAESITANEKILTWFDMSATHGLLHTNWKGMTVILSVLGINIVLCQWAAKVLNYRTNLLNYESGGDEEICLPLDSSADEKSIYNSETLKIIINANYLILLLIPGFLISLNYNRLFYGILLIDYCMFAEAINMKAYTKNLRRWLLFLAFSAFCWSLLLLAYYCYGMTQHDVFATLKDNMLFSW